MDYNEIRLRILNFLYQQHFAGKAMRYCELEDIVKEAGLEKEDPNVINGNALYLYNKKLVVGTRQMGVAQPTSLYINENGIDFVEQVCDKTIQKMRADKKDILELDKIEKESNHATKIGRFIRYVLTNPELVKSYINTIIEEMGKYGLHPQNS
jgi:hypothetical protein